MALLGQLKLAGMRAAYDEVVAAGVRAQHPFQRIFADLLLAQLADHRARSTAYRMGVVSRVVAAIVLAKQTRRRLGRWRQSSVPAYRNMTMLLRFRELPGADAARATGIIGG